MGRVAARQSPRATLQRELRSKAMSTDQALREHLLYLLGGGGAHVDFETVVKDFPPEIINRKAENMPYTPWQVLEHMRIAQWDILEFSRNSAHVSPPWP